MRDARGVLVPEGEPLTEGDGLAPPPPSDDDGEGDWLGCGDPPPSDSVGDGDGDGVGEGFGAPNTDDEWSITLNATSHTSVDPTIWLTGRHVSKRTRHVVDPTDGSRTFQVELA